MYLCADINSKRTRLDEAEIDFQTPVAGPSTSTAGRRLIPFSSPRTLGESSVSLLIMENQDAELEQVYRENIIVSTFLRE